MHPIMDKAKGGFKMCVMELLDVMPKSQEISIWQIPLSLDEDIELIYKGRSEKAGVIPMAAALSEVHQLYSREADEIRIIIKEELPF